MRVHIMLSKKSGRAFELYKVKGGWMPGRDLLKEEFEERILQMQVLKDTDEITVWGEKT